MKQQPPTEMNKLWRNEIANIPCVHIEEKRYLKEKFDRKLRSTMVCPAWFILLIEK